MSPEHRLAIGGGYLIAPVVRRSRRFRSDWLVIKRWPDPRDRSAARERGDADRDDHTQPESAVAAAESKPSNHRSGNPSSRADSLAVKWTWAATLAISASADDRYLESLHHALPDGLPLLKQIGG
jgi:hypothetical protein